MQRNAQNASVVIQKRKAKEIENSDMPARVVMAEKQRIISLISKEFPSLHLLQEEMGAM